MRNLDRDRQAVYIARYEGLEPVRDDKGRLTGKHEAKRSEPVKFYPTVSASRGKAEGALFGQSLDYDRTLTIDDRDFEVNEADVLWVDQTPDNDTPYDYTIKRVARKGSYCVLAIKHVEVRP